MLTGQGGGETGETGELHGQSFATGNPYMKQIAFVMPVLGWVLLFAQDALAEKTVTIDTNIQYSGSGQTCCTDCSNLDDVTSDFYSNLTTSGWTGDRYVGGGS